MSEPTIERSEQLEGVIYTLRVPIAWLVRVRHPRLALTYWLLRMVWRA